VKTIFQLTSPGSLDRIHVEVMNLQNVRLSLKMITLSIAMIVKNEEKNLPRCLSSVRGLAEEIIVVDTGSTDRTVSIAREFGAKVFHFD